MPDTYCYIACCPSLRTYLIENHDAAMGMPPNLKLCPKKASRSLWEAALVKVPVCGKPLGALPQNTSEKTIDGYHRSDSF